MAKGQKTGGRKKGTPNKLTGALKDMILEALDDVGGKKYLAQQAAKSPAAFLALVGKVLPLQVSGVDGAPIETHSRIDMSGLDNDQLKALSSIKVE